MKTAPTFNPQNGMSSPPCSSANHRLQDQENACLILALAAVRKESIAGESLTAAEGATAPETLRHPDRIS